MRLISSNYITKIQYMYYDYTKIMLLRYKIQIWIYGGEIPKLIPVNLFAVGTTSWQR